MTQGTKQKFKQLVVIIISYWIISLIISVYDHLTLHGLYSEGPKPDYTFTTEWIRNMIGGICGGVFGGSFLVFFVNTRYRDKPYAYTIVAVLIAFVVIFTGITILMGVVIAMLETGKSLLHPDTKDALALFLSSSTHIKSAMTWSLVVAATQLILQVNSKFGQGVFWNILRGRYNTPQEEERIFMFLDLNSSTTIAERLGNKGYHNLLKDFFDDITNPIIENRGEIYQYVGDGIVLTWPLSDDPGGAHCIRCYFAIKAHIETLLAKYASRYGVVPTFKAGVHGGQVTVGEIGIIKRDITYSGDVLNTAARILSMCSQLNSELVISDDVASKIKPLDNYASQPLGHIKLKGKERELLLVSVTPRNS